MSNFKQDQANAAVYEDNNISLNINGHQVLGASTDINADSGAVDQQQNIDYKLLSLAPIDKSQYSHLDDLADLWSTLEKDIKDDSALNQVNFKFD